MKLARVWSGALAVALASVVIPAVVEAQTPTCNLVTPCGSSPACRQGCAASVSVWHASLAPCGVGTPIGGFDLRGTEFETTCAFNCGTISAPPMRFWAWDAYGTANSGCVDNAASQFIINTGIDFGLGTPGYWNLFQANWQNNLADGCFQTAPNSRTVAEISWPDTPSENTVNHRSWYLVSSVDGSAEFNFDRITQGTGCAAAVIPAQVLGGVTVSGLAACTGGTTPVVGGDNAIDTNYFDIDVSLADASPDAWTEAGAQTGASATPLILGYQILYSGGTTKDTTTEPRSSNFTTGGWTVARSSANPAQKMAPVPWGTATATVAIPKGTCSGTPITCPWYWLATRIVYRDATLNPAGAFDPATSGPLVVSDVSGHCGPVAGGSVIAVTWKSASAERTAAGVKVSWETLTEDDTLGFVVRRVDGPSTESVIGSAEARGPFFTYDVVDASAHDTASTYQYYVQEITTNGDGDRSPLVTVPAQAAPTTGRTGGRSRGVGRGR